MLVELNEKTDIDYFRYVDPFAVKMTAERKKEVRRILNDNCKKLASISRKKMEGIPIALLGLQEIIAERKEFEKKMRKSKEIQMKIHIEQTAKIQPDFNKRDDKTALNTKVHEILQDKQKINGNEAVQQEFDIFLSLLEEHDIQMSKIDSRKQ